MQLTSSEMSNLSTASCRTLRPRVPINYSNTLLKQLHRRPQIRTLNNISILLSDFSEEDVQEDTDEDINTNITTSIINSTQTL